MIMETSDFLIKIPTTEESKPSKYSGIEKVNHRGWTDLFNEKGGS